MNREEFGMWKLHPGTESFLAHVQVLISEGLEELSSGVYANDMSRTYLAIGKMNAYKSILDSTFIEDKE